MKQFTRTELLLGEEGMSKLKNSKVLIFGVGGVGGYVVEALARSGIGHLALVDSDVVDITNINRQIIATLDVVGKPKVEVFRDRIKAISPDTSVETHQVFYLPAANLSGEAKTSNIITLDDAVLSEMQEKAQPVYDKVRADLGDDIVDTFLNASK